MIKNIHTIERRGDLKITFRRIYDYLTSQRIGSYLFLDLVNYRIRYWDHNKGALNIKDYFYDIGIDIKHNDKNSHYLETDNEILLFIQFIFEFFFIIEKNLSQYSINKNLYNNWATPLAKMIRERLELSNYSVDVTEEDKVFIRKRNAEIDTAIQIIEDKQIIEDILSFYDFRNENDLIEKKSIITRFYKYLEKEENSKYKNHRIKISSKSKEINLFDNFFMIANNFDIRHSPEKLKQIGTIHKLDEKRTLELLNLEFKLFLRITTSIDLLKNQEYIDELINEFQLKSD